ncbi:hypothetical protein LLEC1_05219 [Akanthomyces lecanii]|uniref:Uncharacterized protein n=1 Tax=Cordyceps confragosa TaxID=2714763 RepID=A0A179IDC0_CORDF|nr:hypothetical protein LLEC1_05219 [Akanthomyces lecanii]
MYVRGGGEGSARMQQVSREKLGRALTALDGQLRGNDFNVRRHHDRLLADDDALLFSPYSLAEYPSILAYLERIGKREAYRTAMAKSDPDMKLVLGADSPELLL